MGQDSEFVKSTVNLKWLIILPQIHHNVQARQKKKNNKVPFSIVLPNESAINGSETIALQQVVGDQDPIYCSAWGMKDSELMLFTAKKTVLTIG